MPPDQQLLVDRQQTEVQRGYRVLAATEDGPAWTAVHAEGQLDLRPTKIVAQVGGEARLTVRPRRATRWIGLELPEQRPDTMDMGGQGFAPRWELLELSDASGAPIRVVVTEVGAEAQLSFRADRRLVLVSWTDEIPAGEAHTLVIRWRQETPYAALDRLATTTIARGQGSPLLLALPTVTGDPGRFPYSLTVHAPAWARLSVSGSAVETSKGPDGITARATGLAGGAAVAALAPDAVDQLGSYRAFIRDFTPLFAQFMAEVSVPLGRWWGLALGGLDLVQLAPGWRPPGVVAGEGVVGLRTALRLKGGAPRMQAKIPDLPSLERVLVGEGMVQASWVSSVGADPRGRVWLEALARASALDQLAEEEALAWRGWLSRCATPLLGARPALSPEVAATTGFRDVSARCAGPLLLGPMLVDRLGAARAESVRHAILPRGAFGAAGLGALMLEVDPSAGPWVQRWLVEGHSAQLSARVSTVREGDGWRTTGVVQADTDLGGAPVWIRLRRGRRAVDALVMTQGAVGHIDVSTFFKPGEVEVDPDRRLLRLASAPVDLGLPSPPQP